MFKVFDGKGTAWILRDKGDALSVYPEDQSFQHVESRWNMLVRTKTPLMYADVHVHSTPVDEAPHVIQYTVDGNHRTVESAHGDAWQSLSDTPTLAFSPPTHLSAPSAPAQAAWIPQRHWSHRTRMPLGWCPPTPVEAQEIVSEVPPTPKAAQEIVAEVPPAPKAVQKIVMPVKEIAHEAPEAPEAPVESVFQELSSEEEQRLQRLLAARDQVVITPAKPSIKGLTWTKTVPAAPAAAPVAPVAPAAAPAVAPAPAAAPVAPAVEAAFPPAPGLQWRPVHRRGKPVVAVAPPEDPKGFMFRF